MKITDILVREASILDLTATAKDDLLSELADRDNAAQVFHRVTGVLEGILRRSAYIALLNENRPVLARLVDICERSAFLAAEIARYPALLDEMFDPRLFTAMFSAADMQRDLDEQLATIELADSEARIEALARFQRATMFRIAVADFSNLLPIMKVSDALTELAEIVIQSALETAWRDLVARHGRPYYQRDGVERGAGFGIAAYGKMGGIELSYGSDLDLVFLHDSPGSGAQTDGDAPIDNGMFYGRLVRRLVHFLTTQTPSGALYEVDTRLRPQGAQ